MTNWYNRIAGLRGWRRYGLAFVLGAGAAAALPPVNLVPVLIVSFTGLAWQLAGVPRGPRAFFLGWFFGFGHFVAGLYWTGLSMLVDAERFALFLPFAVVGLPAYLAIYTGLATWAAAWARLAGVGRIAALALAWSAGEYLRGRLFTGFPWNLIGYAWTETETVLQVTAVTGIYGLGLLTVLGAAMPAVLAEAEPRRWRAWLPVGAVFALLAAVAAGGAIRLAGAETAEVPGVRLRIVQPNIPQERKWRRAYRDANLARLIELTKGPGGERATHVIWPETALPFFAAADPKRLELVAAAAPENGFLLTGAPRRSPAGQSPRGLWNSLQAINRSGRIVATYDKVHLVPFGEYLPFRPLLSAIGFSKLTQGTLDFSPGRAGDNLALPGLPPFRPLICYEVIFPEEIVPGRRPGWLLNLTNDAWFGRSPGPYQHFAMARVRTIELGVPLVRAANTGISAIVDPYGRVVSRLDLGRAGVIDGPLPAALERPPPYARYGELVFGLLAVVLAAIVAVSALRRRRPTR